MGSRFGFHWLCLWFVFSVAFADDQAEGPAADEDPPLPEIDSRTFIPDANGPCAKSCSGYSRQHLCAFDQQANVLRSFQNTCDLQIGECYAARIFTVLSYEEACEYACPRRCPDEQHEVCGSDNVTYSNPCRMKQTACKLRSRLVFQSWGRCKKDKLVFPTPYIR